eukprot:521588_1
MGDSLSHELEESNRDMDLYMNTTCVHPDEEHTFGHKTPDIHLLIVNHANDVKTNSQSKHMGIQIDPTATIRQLKSKVAVRFTTDSDSFTLYLPGLKPLYHDHLALSDYGITNGQILSIQFQISHSRHDFLVDYVYYNGDKLPLHNRISTSHTVLDLKQVIEELHSIPCQCQILSFRDNEFNKVQLTDHQELSVTRCNPRVYLEVSAAYKDVLSLVQPIEFERAAGPTNEAFECALLHSQFYSTMPSSVEIVNMYKIEKNLERNVLIYENVMSTMSNKKEDLLFHGTSLANIEKIILNGFNRDYNKRSAYGKGTYFAKHARTALGYSKKNEKLGISAMLVCRVIIGNYGLYKRSEEQQLDSFVNHMDNPTIFVVNRDYHAVPLYLITFKQKREC